MNEPVKSDDKKADDESQKFGAIINKLCRKPFSVIAPSISGTLISMINKVIAIANTASLKNTSRSTWNLFLVE
jgi:hypothetical protein